MTYADWVQAGIAFLGTLAAIITAVLISPWLAEQSQKKGRQEQILRQLLLSRHHSADPLWQASIGLIILEFHGNEEVMNSHAAYLEAANKENLKGDPEVERKRIASIDSCQDNLIAAIFKSVGVPVTTQILRQSAYVSQGYVNRENLITSSHFALISIADTLHSAFPPTADKELQDDRR